MTGYRVVFASHGGGSSGGGCNLEAEGDHEILGLIYELSDEEFDQLDRISGVDRGYCQRVGFTVTAENGGEISAFTYVIPASAGLFRPTAAYTRPILAGAYSLKLPSDYIAELEQTVRVAVMTEDA